MIFLSKTYRLAAAFLATVEIPVAAVEIPGFRDHVITTRFGGLNRP